MYAHFSINNFFHGVIDYLKIISADQIMNYETNYSNRNILRNRLNNVKYNQDLPAAILTLTNNLSSNNNNLKFRFPASNDNHEETLIAYNLTKNEKIYTHIKEETFTLGIRINVHNAYQTVDFINIFTDNLPMARWYYPFEYTDKIEIGRLTSLNNWDFDNDDIENVVYSQERTTGKFLYFANYITTPMFRFNSIDSEIDYDIGRYSVVANFEVKMMLPHNIVITDKHEIRDIIPIINIEKQNDKNTTSYREVNDIDQYIDDARKEAILINKKQFNLDLMEVQVEKEILDNLTENDLNKKMIIFVDSDHTKLTDKQQIALRIEPELITEVENIYKIDISKWNIDLLKFSILDRSNMLITLSVFK